MAWITQRERDLMGRTAPVLLRRFDDIVRDWHTQWAATVDGSVVPPDVAGIAESALRDGVDRAMAVQREVGRKLARAGVPLEQVVTAVLLWDEAVKRVLARDGVEDIFSSSAALNRFSHRLVLVVSEEYRERMRRERDQVRESLEDADRLKMELISMISHDLQTPITTIRGCASSMLDVEEMERAQQRRFLEMMLQNADRLSRLISQILDVSRIESRTLDLEPDTIDAASLVTRIIESMPTPVRLDLARGLPPVRADRDALERIVVNLVDNAIRYCPPGCPVTVSVDRPGEQVELRVTDEGPGIRADRREGLFSKFYQVDPSLSGKRGGSGLGLAIVRGLAQSMNGSAGYRPNPRGGSVFWVRLPIEELERRTWPTPTVRAPS